MRDEEYRKLVEGAPSRRLERTGRRRRRRFAVRLGAWIALIVAVLFAAFVATALYTDRPQFCASCHEMAPYRDAWSAGPHSRVSCVECHVAPGLLARFAHKFTVLGEVTGHFAGDTKFPRVTPPDVPNSRCLPCHTTLPDKTASGFLHSQHVSRGTCAQCHSDTGHPVTDAALQAAGIFSANEASRAAVAGRYAVIDAGLANLAGHQPIGCSRCHNLAETGCQRCHTPKHVPRGTCEKCHKPGLTWVFTHPKGGVDCSSCHKAPAKHINRIDCLSCHPDAGVSWKRKHIAGQDCAGCHLPPANHHAGKCPVCHKKAGVSWKFSHPAATADCEGCHPRPSGHRAGACTDCHKKPGVSWAFSHPKSSACATCHTAPASHESANPPYSGSGSCGTCHKKPGVTFAFTHPSTHHSWRSRACVKCHPRNYTSHSCTCHGGGR